MSTVQVLCPNGRRQNVKVTPNTKLLQVKYTDFINGSLRE